MTNDAIRKAISEAEEQYGVKITIEFFIDTVFVQLKRGNVRTSFTAHRDNFANTLTQYL
jgi:cell division ATPase FtsA